MDTAERVEFVKHAFEIDFGRFGQVVHLDEATWELEILWRPEIDPYTHHKHFGLLGPHLADNWRIGLCAERFVRFAQREDDEQFREWVMYWTLHMYYHVIVFFESNGVVLPSSLNSEEMVDVRMKSDTGSQFDGAHQMKQVVI